MSVLMVNESVDFSTLKSLLGLTDGNLASHIRALEELGYLQTEKRFIGRRPNTSYSVTKAGSKAFRQHLQAMEDFFKSAPSV
ncbi:MAG: transcriptional regulator [Bacteroidales bacterium]|nr:transcriptional regulator [Bacteroidales bacterium]